MILMVLLCFLGIHYAQARSVQEIREYFMSQGVECTKDYPLSIDEMKMLEEHKLPESENAKCFVACIYKRVNWIDGNGMFDSEEANAFVKKEHADDPNKIENSKKLIEECKQVNDVTVSDGTSGCERSALLTKCLLENASEMGIENIQ